MSDEEILERIKRAGAEWEASDRAFFAAFLELVMKGDLSGD